MQSQKKLTPAQAWEKMKHYCAWQERCHAEVALKLAGHGVDGPDASIIISRLIEEGYLNEERFAIQFAGGHFRTKQWGRKKIVYGLRQKGVSDWCIRRALEEIPEDDYMALLQKLAESKWKLLARNPPPVRVAKTRNYLMQKGFEPDLIRQYLKAKQGNGG
jgi:regulatory protein